MPLLRLTTNTMQISKVMRQPKTVLFCEPQ